MYVLVGVVVGPVGVKKQRNVTCTTKSITILLIFPIIGSTFHIHEWTLNRVDVLSCGRPANRDRVWDGREIDLYVHPPFTWSSPTHVVCCSAVSYSWNWWWVGYLGQCGKQSIFSSKSIFFASFNALRQKRRQWTWCLLERQVLLIQKILNFEFK